jgi:CheY-like chemotaxis protein
MNPYELFREDLYDALNHLHDPDYQASPTLIEVVTSEPAASTSSVQYAIIQAIKQLAPPSNTPESASIQCNYELLIHRFIENLTQTETAKRLHTTERNIRRKQRVATHMLARFLWEQRGRPIAGLSETVSTASKVTGSDDSSSRSWRSQARQELASLRQSDPTAIANVDSVIHRAVELEKALVERYGTTLIVDKIAESLTAAVHPTALRQIFIMVISQLSKSSRPCEIHVDAWEEDGFVVLKLYGAAYRDPTLDDGALTTEMLHLIGGSLTTTVEEEAISVTLRVPAMGQVNVAVIDDNWDFIHFCQRCVRGTHFRILNLEDWTVMTIRKADADVILLDIMLPEVDGWELLEALQKDPVTTTIPVVICSIVREEDLAALMGAVKYLPKPIHHRDLLNTLEKVTSSL